MLGVGKVTVASTMVRETADRQLGVSGEVNTPTGRRIMQMVMRIESQATRGSSGRVVTRCLRCGPPVRGPQAPSRRLLGVD